MMSWLVLLNKGDKSASAVVKVPKFTGMTYAKAKKTATSNGLSLVRLGTGSKVLSQKAGAGETVSVGSTVFVLTSRKISLPDFTGWSESQIEAYASLAGIKLQLSGSGKVKSQSLAQGTVVKSGTKLKVELKE